MSKQEQAPALLKWFTFDTDDQAEIWIDYATASLKVANLWDSSIDGPNDSDKTKLVLQLNLSKTYYERWFKKTPTKGQSFNMMIWENFKRLYQNSSTSSKVTSLLALTEFSFSEPKMVDNRKIFEGLIRTFKSSFGGTESINIADLVACLLLAKMPQEYATIRQLFEQAEINKKLDEKSSVSVDAIFNSLESQEANNECHALANVARTPLSGDRNQTTNSDYCHLHKYKNKHQCFKCHPSLAPKCKICEDAGFQKFLHPTGNFICKMQQKSLKSSAKANSILTTEDLSNPNNWNVDSGASTTISGHGNKAGIKKYSTSSRLIQTANGQLVKAIGIGNHINQSLPIKDVLICPEIKQNLLSTGALADQGIQSVFTDKEVLIGNFSHLLAPIKSSAKAIGKRTNGSYILHYPALDTANMTFAEAHVKLGHPAPEAIKTMVDSGIG